MSKFVIYSKPNCNFCTVAKQLLKKKELDFEEKILDTDYTREDAIEVAQKQASEITFPLVVIDGKYIGGAKELHAYFKNQ